MPEPTLRPRRTVTHSSIAGVLLLALVGVSLSGPSHAQYEEDIARWVAQDALSRPRTDSILFTGSSSIRRWEQLAFDFRDYHVIQRGFGGAHFDDLNRYVEEIVLPYRPRAIVIWAGTNDIASGSDGAEVVEDYQEFVGVVRNTLPGTEVFYLGVMPTPGRFANGPQESIANRGIELLSEGDPKLHYIDLPSAFRSLNPSDSGEFSSKFVDSIHLNREGYALWTSVIRPQIQSVLTPDKTPAQNPESPAPGARILFDFGPSNSEDGDHTTGVGARGNHWNNWHAAEGQAAVNAGEHLANLIDSTGQPTGIDLTITGGFLSNGKLNGGLLDPREDLLGDLAVATATQDFFYTSANNQNDNTSDDQPGGFMLSGLDPALRYELRFFGSRALTAVQETEYLVTGANHGLAVLTTSGSGIGGEGAYSGNDNRIARVAGIQPDQYGQVFVDITLRRGSFAYLNAMEIVVTAPEPSTSVSTVIGIGSSALAFRGRDGQAD